MTEPAVLQLAERHLGDPLDPQRNPAEILACIPSTAGAGETRVGVGHRVRPVGPRMTNERAVGQRLQFVQQLTSELGRERCRDADVVQLTICVVQAEEQRSDALAVLVDPIAGHNAIGGPGVFDLDQRALVGRVHIGQAFCDHTVEAGALETAEPLAGRGRIPRRRAEIDRIDRTRQRLLQMHQSLC